MRDLTVSQTGATPTSYGVIWSHLTLLVTLHLSLAQPEGWRGERCRLLFSLLPCCVFQGGWLSSGAPGKRGVSEESPRHRHRRTALRISPASKMWVAPGNRFYGMGLVFYFKFLIGSLSSPGESYWDTACGSFSHVCLRSKYTWSLCCASWGPNLFENKTAIGKKIRPGATILLGACALYHEYHNSSVCFVSQRVAVRKICCVVHFCLCEQTQLSKEGTRWNSKRTKDKL